MTRLHTTPSLPATASRSASLATCAAALLLAALPVAAAPPPTGKPAAPSDACAGSATEAALLACRTRQHDQASAAQTRLLDTLRKRLEVDEPERLKLLLAAQAAFAQYRDAECRLRTLESRDGKAFQVYWLACLTDLNRQRSTDLQRLVDNP